MLPVRRDSSASPGPSTGPERAASAGAPAGGAAGTGGSGGSSSRSDAGAGAGAGQPPAAHDAAERTSPRRASTSAMSRSPLGPPAAAGAGASTGLREAEGQGASHAPQAPAPTPAPAPASASAAPAAEAASGLPMAPVSASGTASPAAAEAGPGPAPGAGLGKGAPSSTVHEAQTGGGFSSIRDGRRYVLHVEQAPTRARMCAFGDKDRRPVSPALIAKLTVTDVATGAVVDPTSFETALFVMTADLVDAATLQPRSRLVARPPTGGLEGDYSSGSGSVSGLGSGSSSGSASVSASASAAPSALLDLSSALSVASVSRNLIGNTTCGAHVARDLKGEQQIFFVLQDVSIRMEGEYRLRLSLSNLDGGGRIVEGMTPLLAEVYTPPFTCYPPRKFPGQVPPTALSRKLAGQGIKLAVRTDHKKTAAAGAGSGASSSAGGAPAASADASAAASGEVQSDGEGDADGEEGREDDS